MYKNISSAFKITFVYFLFSVLWIYFSDNAINLFVKDLEYAQFLQTIKGWFFITISSFLLFLLSKKYFLDIQEEKIKLLETNEVLEKIIENAPIMIFWKDTKGVYRGCNTELLELMGVSKKDDLIGKTDLDLNIHEKQNFVNDDIKIMKTKKPKLNYLETITTKDKIKYLNTSKVPLFDKNNVVIGVLGVVQDITEKLNNENQIKSQEELLIQQSKLAAMGEMIANIAHQWRQPLSVISTLSTGIKLQKELNVSNDDYEKESLDMINENVQYLSKTIDDFKNFFRKDNIKTKVNTKVLLNKTLKLTDSRLKAKNILIIEEIELIEFLSYESEVIQVLINLINNSIDAFEDQIIKDKYIFIEVKVIDENIEIILKDNAGGIPINIINRIFEPYFTTKGEKQGTGIGLYMCNEIITKHLNGKISSYNETFTYLDTICTGAVFKIVLPLN